METYEQTLKRQLKIALKVCDSVNIPYGKVVNIKVNTRAKSRWGLCRHLDGMSYEIEISDRLLQSGVSNMALMNTLLHEILHTCKGCMNHGPKWKSYASRLNAIGYDIKRCTSAAEKHIPEEQLKRTYKYEVTCENCGRHFKYQRKGDVVKQMLQHPHNHGCRCVCGSMKLRLKTL